MKIRARRIRKTTMEPVVVAVLPVEAEHLAEEVLAEALEIGIQVIQVGQKLIGILPVMIKLQNSISTILIAMWMYILQNQRNPTHGLENIICQIQSPPHSTNQK